MSATKYIDRFGEEHIVSCSSLENIFNRDLDVVGFTVRQRGSSVRIAIGMSEELQHILPIENREILEQVIKRLGFQEVFKLIDSGNLADQEEPLVFTTENHPNILSDIESLLNKECEHRIRVPGGFRCEVRNENDATYGKTTLAICRRCDFPEMLSRCREMHVETVGTAGDGRPILARDATVYCDHEGSILVPSECLGKQCFRPCTIRTKMNSSYFIPPSSLEEALSTTEGQHLEFKGDLDRITDIGKHIAAFASADGGVMFLGVDNDHNITESFAFLRDQAEKDTLEQRLQGIARSVDPPVPRIDIIFHDTEDSCVVEIRIWPGDKPLYFHNQKPYIRRGSESRPPIASEAFEIYRNYFESIKE